MNKIGKVFLATVGVVVAFAVVGCSKSIDTGGAHMEQLKARLEQPSSSDVLVVAHRTCWRASAENSLEGIRRCIDLGVDMIEIDVRETSDSQLVLMHDAMVDRTTNGSGLVSELSFADIQELQLKEGGGDSERLTQYRVPTLRDALREAKGRVLVNLDIKEDLYERALGIAQEEGVATEIIIKMGVAASDARLTDAAFHGLTYFMPIVRECREGSSSYCLDELARATLDYKPFDPVAIEVVNRTDEYLLAGAGTINQAGMRLWVNSLGPNFAAGRSDEKSLTDPDGNWGYLVDHGVNMIQTDRPELLLDYLKKRGARIEQ